MSAKAQIQTAVEADGHTISELHQSINTDTPGFHAALEKANKIMAWKEHKTEEYASNEMIADTLGMSPQDLDDVYSGKASPA